MRPRRRKRLVQFDTNPVRLMWWVTSLRVAAGKESVHDIEAMVVG